MTYLFVGASSEIARKCAQQLGAEGHHIIGVSRNSEAGEYASFYQVDSYQLENLPLPDQVIDGLVYFPGTVNLKPFNRLSRTDFLEDFEVNVLGAVSAVQRYLPALRKSTSPSVVFISSVAAQIGLPMHASISVAKAGIEGLTKSLAAELASVLRVNCIAPSLVETPLTAKFTNTPEKQEAMRNRNPSKKIGSPTDIAHMINFLLSPKSNWITGQVMAVDGGMNSLKL